MTGWVVTTVAIMGAAAAMIGAVLFWLVLTRPVAVAQAFGGTF